MPFAEQDIYDGKSCPLIVCGSGHAVLIESIKQGERNEREIFTFE